MKRILLYISTFLIVAGVIGRLYAAQASYVTPEGMIVDSAWLPVGTLMIVLGVLALIVLGVLHTISHLKNRSR